MDLLIELTDSELDAVAGGAASASLTVKTLFASGPASATATASGIVVSAATVGGLSPSNSANVAGTFTATSS